MAFALAETRSDERASIVLKEVGGNLVSDSTLSWIGLQLGTELANLRDHAPEGQTLAKCNCAPPPSAMTDAWKPI
jgi:hypothetical protein